MFCFQCQEAFKNTGCDVKGVCGKTEDTSNLQDLLIWFGQTFGEPFITSAYRANSAGVHSVEPLRGLDVRSYIYTNPENVAETINSVWEYDNTRPVYQCAILHDTGHGMHIHLQVHDNTRKK